MKMKNVEDVRNHLLDSLEKLANNKIDVVECGIIAKTAESIFCSLKLQLTYCSMRGETPNLDFLQKCNQVVQDKYSQIKKIEHK